MLKTLKRIWERVYVGLYPILKFGKRLMCLMMVVGCVVAIGFYESERRANMLGRNLNVALDHWTQKDDQTYLNVNFKANEIPVLFSEEKIKAIVAEKLKWHNKNVRAEQANRANGFVVRENIRYTDIVRAYYMDDKVFLVSQEYLKVKKWEESIKQHEIVVPNNP